VVPAVRLEPGCLLAEIEEISKIFQETKQS
jgi:hypothetical protein